MCGRQQKLIAKIHASLAFQACISFLEVFQERVFKEMLAVSSLILQARIFLEVFQTKVRTSVLALFASKMPLLM